MNRPTCDTCAYWNQSATNRAVGWCHGAIPRIGEECRRKELGNWAKWPLTSSEDFCKEHPDFAAWVESEKSLTPEGD
jgi:hypothetical protein